MPSHSFRRHIRINVPFVHANEINDMRYYTNDVNINIPIKTVCNVKASELVGADIGSVNLRGLAGLEMEMSEIDKHGDNGCAMNLRHS